MQLKQPDPSFLQVRTMDPPQAIALLAQHLLSLVSAVNNQVSVGYTAVASAAAVKVGSSIQFISGTATISTISVAEGLIGPLVLVSQDGFSYTTGGNIAATGTVPAGTIMIFVWEGRMWYPLGLGSGGAGVAATGYATSLMLMGG